MAVQVRLIVEGQADTDAELQSAVAYLDAHPHIIEWSYHEVDRLLYGTTVTFPWVPNPPAAEDALIADPSPVTEETPTDPPVT